ncbi:ornithine cyclodeaminase family protein [bacterium]|nr:ornithine cyclodeaminase family protein [bacterium]
MNLLYLSRADVESLNIGLPAIIEVVEEGFRLKGLGQTEMPPKTSLHPHDPTTFLNAMPAYIGGDVKAAAMKWVGGADDNYKQGLPTITGLLIFNDPITMVPLAVMDCAWLTMMRTAAANAVAMKYLAPRHVGVVSVIGCGVQGRANLRVMALQYPSIREARVYDINPDVLARCVAEAPVETGLNIVPVASAEAAVRDADIVVTAGYMPPNPTPYIENEWLKPGAMAAPVDYNVAFQSELCQRVDKLVTDDIGQMNYYRTKGYFEGVPQAWDLGDVVAGTKPGRQTDGERTMSMCMGIGIDDAVTAKLIYETARARGVGTQLPL